MKTRPLLFALAGLLLGLGVSNLLLRPEPHLGYGVIAAIGATALVLLLGRQLDRQFNQRQAIIKRIRDRGPMRVVRGEDGKLYYRCEVTEVDLHREET
jgi:hypothetical protein